MEEEARKLLKELQLRSLELADLEREWDYLLRRTPVHVPAARREELKTRLEEVRSAVERLRSLLRERGYGSVVEHLFSGEK